MNSVDSDLWSKATLTWVQNEVGTGTEIKAVKRIAGATSSTLYFIQTERHQHKINFVLRYYTNTEWLAEEPDLVGHEIASLEKVTRAGIKAPQLVASDCAGEHTNGVPAILMTALPGQVDLLPENLDKWLYQLAEALLPIHALDSDDFPWFYKSYNDVLLLAVPAWSHFPELWERAIAIVNDITPDAPKRFIHRDYHPNNVLWHDGDLSGIVDWPVACQGPAAFDVAWCRRNLIHLHGIAAADQFLVNYCTLAGSTFQYDPFWDLMALIECLPGPPKNYLGWTTNGIPIKQQRVLIQTLDAFLLSVLNRF